MTPWHHRDEGIVSVVFYPNTRVSLCFRSRLTCGAARRRRDVVVVVWGVYITGLCTEGRIGHTPNARQTLRGSLGHGGTAALQQELSVIDDPGTFSVKRRQRRGEG